jgi:hypothetical protein
MNVTRPLLLLPLLALAACQTPREACVSEVTAEQRVIEGLIAETRGNIERGYAIEEEQVVDVVSRTCRTDEGATYFCDRTEVRDVERPVAIDLNAEQAKLESLLERRGALRAGQANALAACQALPDE